MQDQAEATREESQKGDPATSEGCDGRTSKNPGLVRRRRMRPRGRSPTIKPLLSSSAGQHRQEVTCASEAENEVRLISAGQKPNGNADAMPEKGAPNNVRSAPTASEDLTKALACVGWAQQVENQTPNSASSSTSSNPAIKLATEECTAEVRRVLKCEAQFTLDVDERLVG